MRSERITKKHRSRLAVVYVRQSTQRQVVKHMESQRCLVLLPDFSDSVTLRGWPSMPSGHVPARTSLISQAILAAALPMNPCEDVPVRSGGGRCSPHQDASLCRSR